jgi:hypothetical protein
MSGSCTARPGRHAFPLFYLSTSTKETEMVEGDIGENYPHLHQRNESYQQYVERHLSSLVFCAWMVLGSIIVAGIIVLVVLAFPQRAHAEENWTDEEIVVAIGKAENSRKFPYVIKSIKCQGEIECRKICLNSVRNAKKRWIKASNPEDFIVFMGRRYSPPAINPNWVKLVKLILIQGRVK